MKFELKFILDMDIGSRKQEAHLRNPAQRESGDRHILHSFITVVGITI